MIITLTEDIIIQSETEKQDKNQISEKKFCNFSDFELKISQRVRFWFDVFTTRQILDWKNYNALDFEFKIFRHVRFWNFFECKEITFCFFLLRENDVFCNIRAFLKSMILNRKKYDASDFEFKKYNASDVELKILQRVRFWVYFFCSLPNFLSFIKRGHVSVMFWCMVWVQSVKIFCKDRLCVPQLWST